MKIKLMPVPLLRVLSPSRTKTCSLQSPHAPHFSPQHPQPLISCPRRFLMVSLLRISKTTKTTNFTTPLNSRNRLLCSHYVDGLTRLHSLSSQLGSSRSSQGSSSTKPCLVARHTHVRLRCSDLVVLILQAKYLNSPHRRGLRSWIRIRRQRRM